MHGGEGFLRFVRTGFELLGIEADEAELAVIGVADSLYRPHTEALLDADLDDVAPEPELDPSAAPPE